MQMQIKTGRLQKAIKCVIYGPEGIGKSTFASMAPRAVFCDVENSTSFMDVARLPKPTSYQMILDEISFLIANADLADTFVLDTADWTEKLCKEQVCSAKGINGIEDIGYGKGYTYIYESFGRILNAMDELINAGINVIITAHAALRKVEQPDEMGAYDRWELKLINAQKCNICSMVKEWADLVLFANYETIVVKQKEGKAKAQGGKRVMYTTHHSCWDAKNRFGLPEKLPFDFSAVANLFHSKTEVASKVVEMQTKRPAAPLSSAEVFPVIDDESDLPFVISDPAPLIDQRIPKALADLMEANDVTESEIVHAVFSKGYFPENMKIADYPKEFVDGVLIGAWAQVFEMIQANRNR